MQAASISELEFIRYAHDMRYRLGLGLVHARGSTHATWPVVTGLAFLDKSKNFSLHAPYDRVQSAHQHNRYHVGLTKSWVLGRQASTHQSALKYYATVAVDDRMRDENTVTINSLGDVGIGNVYQISITNGTQRGNRYLVITNGTSGGNCPAGNTQLIGENGVWQGGAPSEDGVTPTEAARYCFKYGGINYAVNDFRSGG